MILKSPRGDFKIRQAQLAFTNNPTQPPLYAKGRGGGVAIREFVTRFVIRKLMPEANNKLVQYIKDIRKEMSIIIWPTRQEALRLTVLVVAGSVAIGLFLAFFDWVFTKGLEKLLTLK